MGGASYIVFLSSIFVLGQHIVQDGPILRVIQEESCSNKLKSYGSGVDITPCSNFTILLRCPHVVLLRGSCNLFLAYSKAVATGGSRKKYWGGAGPSSFGRQQRLSEITTEPINSTSSRTTVSNCSVSKLCRLP